MKASLSALALAFGLVAAGSFAVADAQGTTQAPADTQGFSLSSPQVQRDLADWEKAGFDPHTADVLSYDVFGREYQHDYAKYEALRNAHAPQVAQNQSRQGRIVSSAN